MEYGSQENSFLNGNCYEIGKTETAKENTKMSDIENLDVIYKQLSEIYDKLYKIKLSSNTSYAASDAINRSMEKIRGAKHSINQVLKIEGV